MNLGIVIYSHDAETVWNAFRFANFSLKEGGSVGVFLLAKGVEYEALDGEPYTIKETARAVSFENPLKTVSYRLMLTVNSSL